MMARRRTMFSQKTKRSPPSPPVAAGVPLLGVLPALLAKGPLHVIRDAHTEMGSVAFDVDFTTRREQFRFFGDAMKPAKLREVEVVNNKMEYFARWGQSGTVDLKQELEQLVTLVASRCLFGEEVRAKMLVEVATHLRELNDGMRLVTILFPHLPIPAHRRRDRARARLGEIFSNIVSARKASYPNSSRHVVDDMLQCLVDSRYKDGRATTETEHGNRLDYEVLQEMDTLHRCVKEVLRLHPPAMMLLRHARQSFTVRTSEGDEYEVPEGRTVASPLVIHNRLPHVFRDPEKYEPDRFGPGIGEDIAGGAFSYTAFGGGRHACIGEAFAYMQIKVIWSHLLRNFEMEMVSPFPETDWNVVMPGPKGKVMVRYNRKRMSAAA
uniref:Obtusifoliol 14-alpha demethylase n=1 Tax=Aegilops tauschii subsp. strangulata TaxID=200361 RepID=A0A453QA65_AEGTS